MTTGQKGPAKRGATFHAFTVTADRIANRILTDVLISDAFDPQNPPKKIPKATQAKALWDTGATKSGVTPETVRTLGLVPTGATRVNHAGGTSKANTYVVNIALPNKVGVPGVQVTELAVADHDFGVVIGMDIITRGDFAITNVNGQTRMSFRMPSIGIIDYVSEARRIKYAGVGRNAPCPCGKKNDKGRPIKFKHCCAGKIA